MVKRGILTCIAILLLGSKVDREPVSSVLYRSTCCIVELSRRCLHETNKVHVLANEIVERCARAKASGTTSQKESIGIALS